MAPQQTFLILAAVFAILACTRLIRHRGMSPAAKTWLLLAVIFGAVGAWLNFIAG